MPAEILLSFDGWTRRVPLGAEPVVLGRDGDCAVQIPDGRVSRHHCRIVPDGGGWLVEDLGSRAGTLLDGVPLTGSAPFRPGACCQFGGAAFRLVEEAEESRSGPLHGASAASKVELLLRTVGDLYGTEDLDELLRTIVDRTILVAGGDRGALLLAGAGGGIEVAVARDAGGVDLPPGHPLTRTLPRRALQTRRPVVLTDAGAQEQAAPESVLGRGLRSVLCVPLPEAAGTAGVLYVDGSRPVEDFTEGDLAVFEALAAQVALAIERAGHRQREALEKRRIADENAALRVQIGTRQPVGESPAVQKALETLRRVARTDATVLLSGETGTGKEILARHLHELSLRAKEPFVVIDCGALPDGLIESELFGHEKGAFTGATGSRLGRFREAHGGTVFLDEIGELPLPLQSKLLRVLQEHTVQPVGGTRGLPVDVRVVCATHRDLERQVQEGTFRQDLYYRIDVVRVPVPPLRERGEDVLRLAETFLARYAVLYGIGTTGFTREATEALLRHRWPGNVRELQNRIQQAILLASPPYVTSRDLGFEAAARETGTRPAEAELPLLPIQEAREQAVERFERGYVSEVLRRTGGNVSQAAVLAGVQRQAMQRLMRRNQLERSIGTQGRSSGVRDA